MSTNYYFHKNICSKCNKPDEIIHIGLSSGGWCFNLHVYPEKSIYALSDWERIWEDSKNCKIVDEHGNTKTIDEMLIIIVDRHGPAAMDWEKVLNNNPNVVKGPNNLCRTKIDGVHTVGHGNGTWDLCIGEFS